MQSVKKSSSVRPAAKRGASSVPSTATDWVATAASSHAPLMPVSSAGFSSRTVTTVKKLNITSSHSSRPSTHSACAMAAAPATTSRSTPSTHVPATSGEKACAARVIREIGQHAREKPYQTNQQQQPEDRIERDSEPEQCPGHRPELQPVRGDRNNPGRHHERKIGREEVCAGSHERALHRLTDPAHTDTTAALR